MSKVFKFSVVFLLILLITCIFCACEEEKEEYQPLDNSDVNLVVLGDSIAEAILGPAPITEREDYSYCGILGQINGFTYHNRAVSGHQTGHLLDYLNREGDDSAYTHITHVKQADIIVISILGNDLLLTQFNQKIIDSMVNDYVETDKILEQSYKNIDGIIKRIKELNPDVDVIIQTVYNPVYPESTILGERTVQTLIDNYGVTRNDLYKIGGKLINRLNNVLRDYLVDNPGAFRIADVNAKFDAFYQDRAERLNRFIYEDCIHPSNEGHAVIASAVQSVLQDLGYADAYNALINYKTLCVNRLNRLFIGTELNLKEIIDKINKANTIDEVTEVYFDSIEGTTPIYQKDYQLNVENKSLKNVDTYYKVRTMTIGGATPMDLNGIIDKETSYFKLGANGEMYFELRIQPTVYSLAQIALGAIDGRTIDVMGFECYVVELLPGETLKELESALNALNKAVGFKVEGLDYTKEEVLVITNSLKNSGQLPQQVKLPSGLYFSLKLPYEMKILPSLTQKEPFTGIYLGEYFGDESYVIATEYLDENGVDCIKIINEILGLEIILEAGSASGSNG